MLLSLCLAWNAGCSPAAPPAAPQTSPTAHRYIKHVVIVIQENRSFDNLFSGYPGADAPSYGYAGTKRTPLRPVALENRGDIRNNWLDGIHGWNHGKMDGFDREHFYDEASNFAYAYVPRDESAPYWSMARQYVLADQMFPTEFGPSFTAHLSLIAGNTTLDPEPIAEVNQPSGYPWGCDGPPGARSHTIDIRRIERFNGPRPCFQKFRTMADTLDAAGVSWKYYASPLSRIGGMVWSEFDSIHSVRYGPDWGKVISPQTKVLSDVEKGALADVTWVTPDWQDSDHTGSGYNRGPSWVASIVNAIGESRYWQSTAIFVLWDDWGGWYDDAPPPQLDYRGLGIRVPCLMISPYARIATGAKRGYVSHTQYEFGSILKFVEEVYALPPLGSTSQGFTDTRATSMLDTFDFTQPPRAFTPIAAPYSKDVFSNERPSYILPDSD